MTDYVAIVLNGLFTGLGVIFANQLWSWFTNYRKHIKEEAKKIKFKHLLFDDEDDKR